MPFVNVSVSRKLSAEEKDKLYAEISEHISLIPGKNVTNTVVCINDDCAIYKNTQKLEWAFVDVRLFKESPEESKKAFSEKLFEIINKTIGIPPEHACFNFIEMPVWASSGRFMQ